MQDSLQIGDHAAIPLSEIVLRTSRSSGPGGQHANVTASRVEASFDVENSSALTDDQKRRIVARGGPVVVAVSQDTRSQTRNRALALARLAGRLEQALTVRATRKATRPSRAATQKRLDAKRHQSERKRARRPPPGADD